MRIQILGSVPVPLTHGSGCGSGRFKDQKHTDPTDPDEDLEHWYIYVHHSSKIKSPK
jgi:hypothetical protein